MVKSPVRLLPPSFLAALGLLASLTACGGGGGGGGDNVRASGGLNDPVIDIEGAPGRFSLTPAEANDATMLPPPKLPLIANNRNHFFRMEVPFKVDPKTLFDTTNTGGSLMNANMAVVDGNGVHVPGVLLLNGIDATGVNRLQDPGVPGAPKTPFVDTDGVRKDVILYISDRDGDLSTFSAFDADTAPEGTVSGISEVNIQLAGLNGVTLNASWQIQVGGSNGDVSPPFVNSVTAELLDVMNPGLIDVRSTFLVEFSEPMIPPSVGRSAELNGYPFNGNLPLPPILPPLPNVLLTATVNADQQTLYVPYDAEPINSNNLTTYRLTPLIDLPANTSVRVQVQSWTVNSNPTGSRRSSAQDLWGNVYDGEDTDLDGTPDGAVYQVDFPTGNGPAVVNIPVAPEVVYWLPNQGRGVGAIDLNGWGFGTNKAGANASRPESAAIITMAAGYNTVNGIATFATPCTGLICVHNQYLYPVGTGSYKYGPNDSPFWDDAADPGNPGTPFPGVNERSSGFETLCRNSNGDVVLTGRNSNEIGILQDMQVGEFLDLVFYDTQNFWADSSFHFSNMAGGLSTAGRNLIQDPPAPNPPPTRYWVGLTPLDTPIDQGDPNNVAVLIEGEEVFTGIRAGTWGFDWLRPNPNNVFAADQTVFPHMPTGPGIQSATQGFSFSARQQIGNYLYVTDAENRMLHALNSNTMRVISSINLPDPTGLGVAPDNAYVYVSNFSDDSLSVIDTDPLSPTFHQEVARVPVGSGPRDVAVQMDNEDIFVSNFGGNSISIVNQSDLTVRKQITALISSPYDVHLTGRQQIPTAPNPYGFQAGIYFGYISNFGGNSLLVFESGPDGPQGIGQDNVLGELPTASDDSGTEIFEPRGLVGSPLPNPQSVYAGGVFLAHRDSAGFAIVSHIQFTNQAQFGPLPIQSPPGFYIPPGFLDRNFDVTAQWGASAISRLSGFKPMDVALADLNTAGYQLRPAATPNVSHGVGGFSYLPPNPNKAGFLNSHHHMRTAGGPAFPTWTPDRLYVCFGDTDVVDVLDPLNGGVVMNQVDAADGLGMKKLTTYFHQ